MTRPYTLFGTLLFLALAATPASFAFAQDATPPPAPPPAASTGTSTDFQFSNEGIFGCNQVAGANASAGTMAAIGGVYVPVNDAAVTLNTGILVYKECVLRPMQDRLRESAMSALLKKNYVGIETGRDGNKLYVVNPRAEIVAVSDKVALSYLTDEALNNTHPSIREAVKRTVAVNYQAQSRGGRELECTYQGSLIVGAADPRQPFDPANFEKLADPACRLSSAYWLAKTELESDIGEAIAYQQMQWDWGDGYYSRTDNAANPLEEQILTPASNVSGSYQQILTSPVRQLESANDIGQMIGALFAGVTTQALTDRGGLAGIGRSIGGQPSYLDQVARESSQGVIGAAVNAALQILRASRQQEARYHAAMSAIANSLTQTIGQLRAAERQCWDLIIPRAEEYADDNGFDIEPATTTVASQQVIDAQIAPLAQAVLTNVQNSEEALGLIDQLIAGVTNTASVNVQRLALQQLDDLVAQQVLHTQQDATNAEVQRDDVIASMETLRADTLEAWGDSQDTSVGWCNVNNPDIPRLWAEEWRD